MTRLKPQQLALLIALTLTAVAIFASVPLGILSPDDLGFAIQALVVFGAILFLYITIRIRSE